MANPWLQGVRVHAAKRLTLTKTVSKVPRFVPELFSIYYAGVQQWHV